MRAIIIGGGIGGLTAAIALRRNRIEADVYERNPEVREVGAGISLWPNAVKAIRKLGLGQVLHSITLVNSEGTVRGTGRGLTSPEPRPASWSAASAAA